MKRAAHARKRVILGRAYQQLVRPDAGHGGAVVRDGRRWSYEGVKDDVPDGVDDNDASEGAPGAVRARAHHLAVQRKHARHAARMRRRARQRGASRRSSMKAGVQSAARGAHAGADARGGTRLRSLPTGAGRRSPGSRCGAPRPAPIATFSAAQFALTATAFPARGGGGAAAGGATAAAAGRRCCAEAAGAVALACLGRFGATAAAVAARGRLPSSPMAEQRYLEGATGWQAVPAKPYVVRSVWRLELSSATHVAAPRTSAGQQLHSDGPFRPRACWPSRRSRPCAAQQAAHNSITWRPARLLPLPAALAWRL